MDISSIFPNTPTSLPANDLFSEPIVVPKTRPVVPKKILPKTIDKDKTKKRKINPKDEKEANERTVYVGNVAKEVSRKEIKALFQQECGSVSTVRLRGLVSEKPNILKQTALAGNRLHKDMKTVAYYVKFKEHGSVAAALKANGRMMHGRHLKVDSCVRTETKKAIRRTIFVGNVAYNADEEQLYEAFSTFDTVESVRVVRDRFTGVGKGIAYVKFESTAGVDLACRTSDFKVGERVMRIDPALCESEIQNRSKGKIKSTSCTISGGKASVKPAKANKKDNSNKKPLNSGSKSYRRKSVKKRQRAKSTVLHGGAATSRKLKMPGKSPKRL